METRCPHAGCREDIDLVAERTGRCPRCGQLMNYRSIAHLNEVEKRWRTLNFAQAEHLELEGTVARITAVLEDIRSLWNVGSIFRSSDGAGVGHLYICGITGTPPRKEIEKTSLGAEQTIGWSYCKGAMEPIRYLKDNGVMIIGLEVTRDFFDIADSRQLSDVLSAGLIKPPVCLVVGNEVTGLSGEVLTQCDFICHLPMRGHKESLNVAVAFGIASYMVAESLER